MFGANNRYVSYSSANSPINYKKQYLADLKDLNFSSYYCLYNFVIVFILQLNEQISPIDVVYIIYSYIFKYVIVLFF